jgi:HAD superfamily hydrolase (TIGR01549 family)
MSKLRGVLLDVDGTLIDSNDAHARAWADTLQAFGYDVSVERIRPLIGEGGDKVVPQLTGLESGSDKGRKISEHRSLLFEEKYLRTLRAFPKAHELLARFKAEGLRLVIATSSDAEQLERMLDQAGLDELVERRTTSSDAKSSKPDPDIIQAALQRGEMSARDVLMLGDTPYDIEAARRAGVKTVAFRCGGWSDVHLGGAVAVYEDASDLLAHYDRSLFSGK